MRARAVAYIGAGLTALVAAALPAEPAPLSATPPAIVQARLIDLTECQTLALAADPTLRSSELESAAANARVRELQGQYVPSVSVQAGYSRLSEVEPGTLSVTGLPVTVTLPTSPLNSTTLKLSVQQPLFTGLRISSSVRQAEAARAAAGSDVQATRAGVRAAAVDAFWQLVRAKLVQRTAAEAEAQAGRRLADVKTLHDQGVATDNDVTQASMRLEDARIESARAASGRELARVRLSQLVGLPLAEPLDVPDAVPPQAPQPAPEFGSGLEDLISRALAARPELAGSRSRVSAQEAGVEVARAGRFPSIFLTGDYTLANPNPRIFPAEDTFTGTWSVGIMAMFDVGRYPQVAAQEEQASNRAGQAREALRRQSDAVAVEVARAAIGLNAALRTWESLRAETAQAKESLAFVEERFQTGVALPSAREDSRSLAAIAGLREQTALVDCVLARADLDQAVGE